LNSDKKPFWLLAAVIILLVILNGALLYRMETRTTPSSVSTYTSNKEEPTKNTITVSGTGTVHSKPDQALITVGVRTEAKSAEDAQQENAKKMNSTIDALKADGISQDNIKTTSYRLEPVMKYDGTPVLVGYQAENMIQITLNDITGVGKVADIAVSAGANEVQSIKFTLTNDHLSSLRNDAIDAAIKDARQKAETTSRSLGVQLIGPSEVSLTTGYEPTPMVLAPKAAGTPVIAGELDISTTVQVVYQFK
jgi:uncharacterized protein YggE